MRDQSQDVSRVRREFGALLLLASCAVVAFGGTRQIAIWQSERNKRDAEAWFQRGTVASKDGRPDDAVVAFRRAHGQSRDNRQFAVAFSHALAADGQLSDSASVLATLRERTPEDPEINLELARLARMSGDVPEALRYYHSALYGVWPVGREEARRAARIELVRFLLEHERRSDAVGELMALTSNPPDSAAHRVEAGHLLIEAGEPRLAREQFQRGLVLDPGDLDARSGAGEASFVLGDYADARRYLQGIPNLPARVLELRDVSAEVLARDPLAPRLRLSERRQRVMDLIALMRARVGACTERSRGPSVGEVARLETAQRSLEALDGQLRLRTAGDVPETIDAAVGALYRIEGVATDLCGDPSVADKALVLIGRANEAGTP